MSLVRRPQRRSDTSPSVDAAATETHHRLQRIYPLVVDDLSLMFGFTNQNNDWVDGVFTSAWRKASRVSMPAAAGWLHRTQACVKATLNNAKLKQNEKCKMKNNKINWKKMKNGKKIKKIQKMLINCLISAFTAETRDNDLLPGYLPKCATKTQLWYYN